MDKEQKKFISGTFFFLLGCAFVSIIPIVFRWLDLYYFLSISQYKNLAIFFAMIGLYTFLTSDGDYRKQVLVCLIGIFVVFFCKLFYM
ncbi:hypothetical protein IJC60_04600 [bacterium]|nr:hypothetical protein [bacterium]